MTEAPTPGGLPWDDTFWAGRITPRETPATLAQLAELSDADNEEMSTLGTKEET